MQHAAEPPTHLRTCRSWGAVTARKHCEEKIRGHNHELGEQHGRMWGGRNRGGDTKLQKQMMLCISMCLAPPKLNVFCCAVGVLDWRVIYSYLRLCTWHVFLHAPMPATVSTFGSMCMCMQVDRRRLGTLLVKSRRPKANAINLNHGAAFIEDQAGTRQGSDRNANYQRF